MSQYKKKKNKRKKGKIALAAHPQNFTALHPKLDLQIMKQNNTTVTIYDLTDISWS